MDDFENQYHTLPYTHRLYAPGTLVYVDPGIRAIHERSLVAGQVVEACEGTYGYSDDPLVQEAIDAEEAKRSHETKVPVMLRRQIWFVEEEYVKRADEVE